MIYGGLFDLDNKIKRRDELKEIINAVDFWNSANTDTDLNGGAVRSPIATMIAS